MVLKRRRFGAAGVCNTVCNAVGHNLARPGTTWHDLAQRDGAAGRNNPAGGGFQRVGAGVSRAGGAARGGVVAVPARERLHPDHRAPGHRQTRSPAGGLATVEWRGCGVDPAEPTLCCQLGELRARERAAWAAGVGRLAQPLGRALRVVDAPLSLLRSATWVPQDGYLPMPMGSCSS